MQRHKPTRHFQSVDRQLLKWWQNGPFCLVPITLPDDDAQCVLIFSFCLLLHADLAVSESYQ